VTEDEKARLTFPDTPEAKLAFNIRSEESMRVYLRSRTWEEKIASIVRMREAAKNARAAMREGTNRRNEAEPNG